MSRILKIQKPVIQFTLLSLALAAILALALAGFVALAELPFVAPLVTLPNIVRLQFVVLDDETSLPVKGAAVCLIDPFAYEGGDRDELVTTSDDRGDVTLSRTFDLGEVQNRFKKGHHIRVLGWRVKVTAADYDTSTTPLFEHTGEVIDEQSPKVKDPNIRLHRRNNSKLNDPPKCATFVYRNPYMRTSLVVSGDKFNALLSCPKQCSAHIGWFEAKYGGITRVNGVLQLTVRAQELIRRGNGDGSMWLENNLVPVRWGNRQYLVGKESGMAFCNAVNLGDEPRKSEDGDFFLVQGHEAMAVTGSPEVPREWSEYLLKAPVACKVIELLPDWMAKVNVGRKHGLRAGMELVSTDEHRVSYLEIASVNDDDSVIRERFPNDAFRTILVGDTLSTRHPASRVKYQSNR